MELVSTRLGVFGDVSLMLFRAGDGRHCVWIVPVAPKSEPEKPRFEWLTREDAEIWLSFDGTICK